MWMQYRCGGKERQRGLNPEHIIQSNEVARKIIQMLGRKITDLMSIDTICGVGVGFRRLMLGGSFPEGRKDGFGVMEVVMHDVH